MNNRYYRLDAAAADEWIRRLAATHEVWAPARMPREGRHSDQPVIGYRPVVSFGEIVWNEKSFYSPKEATFPIRETLFRFVDGTSIEAPSPARPVLILARPCDINGVARLDAIFLRNGSDPDYYYSRRRRLMKFLMIECERGFDSCFCVSMGANRTDDYAGVLRPEAGGLSLSVRDEELLPLGAELRTRDAFEPRFPTANALQVALPDPAGIEPSVLEHEMWQEYSRRCIACGRCNTSCVTCSCFSLQDVFHDDARQMGERRRVWTGCHLDGFTDMAGGHAFRKTNGARMRFKVLHKVYDFERRFGQPMCVGCGRCDDVCPEYISFSRCVNKLARLVGPRGAAKPETKTSQGGGA